MIAKLNQFTFIFREYPPHSTQREARGRGPGRSAPTRILPVQKIAAARDDLSFCRWMASRATWTAPSSRPTRRAYAEPLVRWRRTEGSRSETITI